MQAFGHGINGFADPDRANMFEQPSSTGGEIGPSPPPTAPFAVMGPYMPAAGRADRLAANIPGGSQSSWGNNGDHTIGAAGGGGGMK